ncbi:MAG: TolC family protein [Cytophagaceae bacterium]|nr:TolC family protein [Cytophagaceae bacterium]MBK9934939.1 TolC family protein [Cytophagaceae bacterium]MBL0301378.1 TolC family protein [Cytophagaceae bacterium]
MKKLFIILFLSNCAVAQNYTLKKCIEVATANNPAYQKTFLTAEVAATNVDQAKARRLPQTQFSVSQGMNFGRSIDRFSNDYINQMYNSTYSGLQVSVPVFKGFQRQFLVESSKFLEEAEKLNIDTEKNRLTLNILKAYLEVLATKEMVQVAEKQLQNSRTQYNRQEKQLQAGITGKLEQVQFANQVAMNEGGLIEAKTSLQVARLALFQLMNLKPADNIDFESLDLSESLSFGIIPVEKDPSLFLPEYKSLDIQSKSIDRQIKANNAEKMPEINLYGNYGTFYASSNPERTFIQQINDTRNGSVSLGVNIPIFSGILIKPRTQQLKVQKRILENTVSQNKNLLNQELETAKLMLSVFQERLENAGRQVEISKENLHLVELRIEAGTINPLEFQVAQASLESAQATQIQSKYRLILQKKLLSFYYTGEFDFL